MGALWELKVTGVDKAEKTIQIHVTKVHDRLTASIPSNCNCISIR